MEPIGLGARREMFSDLLDSFKPHKQNVFFSDDFPLVGYKIKLKSMSKPHTKKF